MRTADLHGSGEGKEPSLTSIAVIIERLDERGSTLDANPRLRAAQAEASRLIPVCRRER